MIRKILDANVGYSVVEFDDVRRVFATVAPSRGVTLPEQTESALHTLRSLFQEIASPGSIVMQSVFQKNSDDRAACRTIIEESYGHELPATNYVLQPPCDGQLLSIEAWGLAARGDDLQIERHGGAVTIARHNGATWAYSAGVFPDAAAGSCYDRSLSAFRAAGERLHSLGWRFDDVISTWLYLGDITGKEGQTTRYLELNRARTDFYRNLKFAAGLVHFLQETVQRPGDFELAIGQHPQIGRVLR